MKPRFVSAVAVLICCAILAVVGLFGYSRYKAAQVANAEFGKQLLAPTQNPLQTHMPDQLPPRSSTAAGAATASPAPGQQ